MSPQAQAVVQAQPKKSGGSSLRGNILQRAAVIPAIAPVHSGILQRCSGGVECAECRANREKREKMMQRAAVNSTSVKAVPSIVHEVLGSSGQPLDAGTRAFMEPRFGYDFSQVRVHTGDKEAESARAVNAVAYTVGRNVVFGTGQYEPGTSDGRRLLAHELTHVVQQDSRPAMLNQSLTIGPTVDPLEREADRVAAVVGHDMTSQVAGKNISGSITRVLQPMLQREDGGSYREDAFHKECPDSVVLADKKPIPSFNKKMFDAGYRTYLGLITNMKVGPKSSYESSITEVLKVEEDSCGDKGNMAEHEPCGPKKHALTVGETCGGDELTGTTFPCSKTTFVDLHRTRNNISLLEGSGKTECKTRCLQRYGCGGKEIGRFYITRHFKAGEFFDGRTRVPITVGSIEKEAASK